MFFLKLLMAGLEPRPFDVRSDFSANFAKTIENKNQKLPMTGFELLISGVLWDHLSFCAISTALIISVILKQFLPISNLRLNWDWHSQLNRLFGTFEVLKRDIYVVFIIWFCVST